MSKLKRFNKSNRKNNTIKLIVAFLLLVIVFGAISYAVYQKEDEVLFINARVGEFETSSSDIELAMTLDGNDIDIPPSKSDGYYNVTVECDHADGRWDEEEWGAIITNISSNRVKCNVNFETLDVLANKVELGDYISMTPTSTSYTISTSLTGYSSNQTINPSELNLWRVIRKNEDGTVDAVSEYVSSTAVYLRGQVGWLNMIGTFNTIAAQYTNEKYVEETRHIGYSSQVEKCTSLSSCPINDGGYYTDRDLVQKAGVLTGRLLNEQETGYWIASRGSGLDGSNRFYSCIFYSVDVHQIASGAWLYYSTGQGWEYKNPVRPILTLKADIKITDGDGRSFDTAYQLQ